MNERYLFAEAAYCRRLAARTRDTRFRKTLLGLAEEYENQQSQRRQNLQLFGAVTSPLLQKAVKQKPPMGSLRKASHAIKT